MKIGCHLHFRSVCSFLVLYVNIHVQGCVYVCVHVPGIIRTVVHQPTNQLTLSLDTLPFLHPHVTRILTDKQGHSIWSRMNSPARFQVKWD